MESSLCLPYRARLGRLWFKYRSFSPLPILLLAAWMTPEFFVSERHWLLVSFSVVLAESLRIWAVGFAGSSTRTRRETVSDFVHSGPYRHVRNPLYIANIILYASCCFGFGHFRLTLFALVYFVIQYSLIVTFEEDTLTRNFRERYQSYLTEVPRWLFSLKPRFPKSHHGFCFALAIRSERSTLIAILGVILLWTLKNGLK